MKLEIIISGREEAHLAAEFMARITALRYPIISHTDIVDAVKEEVAGIVAEQVIEKVAKAPKVKKADPAPQLAPIDQVEELDVTFIKVDRAALQRLAAAKASGGKAAQVKEIIASYGTKIIEVPEEKLAELLSRLEALE